MKKYFFASFFILPLLSLAQFKVTIKLKVPAAFANNKIYFASSLNNWTPEDNNFALTKNTENVFEITIPNCPASFKGKFTCGSWETVECTLKEADIIDRTFEITKEQTIELEVENFKKTETKSLPTKSTQVKIISDSFYIPQLKATRRIWMYVPKTYDGKKKFPVLYMQDGQNLFDSKIAFAGEWGIDEYLDSTKKECIVIGIDNGKERIQEYNAYNNPKYGIGKGKEYIDFIVQTLKPFIDKNYATLADKKNTYIAGSSMGALISFYGILKYPNIFGKAVILSPSFWLCEKELTNTIKATINLNTNGFYFYYGQKESATLETEVKKIANATKQKCATCNVLISQNKTGEHNEKYWQAELPKIFDWIFTNK